MENSAGSEFYVREAINVMSIATGHAIAKNHYTAITITDY
jgi:hypothetical protein